MRSPLVLAFVLALSACSNSHQLSCDSDRDCSASGLVCDFTRSLCAECVRDADCTGEAVCVMSHCEAPRPCTSSRECPGLVCEPSMGRCVECVMDADCGPGEGCASTRCVPLGHDAGPPTDAGPPIDAALPRPDAGRICVEDTNEVDLLFMIDNSNSMSEEQASLVATLPALIRAISTGDVDGDGIVEFAGVGSIHVGVVTSDMGTGGFMTATCGNGTEGHMHGDDGVLRTQGRADMPGCAPTFPRVLTFARGVDDPDAFAASAGCVVAAGTGGCGFEQPLEAVLKAVSPASPTAYTAPTWSPPTFFADTAGHGDGLNAGFLRPDSVLAIVFVTDEEDCSAIDVDLFNLSSAVYGAVDFNLRCFNFPDVIHPIERYTDGLAGVRLVPQRLVVGFVTGIPPETEPTGESVDWEAILASEGMIERVDPANPTRLRPSCTTASGIAFPPRRLIRLGSQLEALGASATAGSICTSDFVPFARRMAASIGRALPATCSH